MNVLPRWVIRTIGYCAAFLLAAATVWLAVRSLAGVLTVSFAVAAALLLAALIYPVADLLRKLRFPDWLASLTTLLLFLSALFLTGFWLVRRAWRQIPEVQSAFGDAVDRLQKLLTGPPLSLPPGQISQVEDRLVNGFSDALPSPGAVAATALQFLTGAVLVLFVIFFLLKDGAGMWSWLVGWVPHRHREKTRQCGEIAWTTLTSYVRGTAIVASIDAVGIGAGMLFLGNPLTASLTVATFIGAFVPIVGAFVTGTLAVALTLVTVGFWAAVVLLIVVVGVQQLEGNVLQPFIMGHALRLSPVAIVLAVTVGSLVGGIIGAIVAVPVTAVSYRVASFLAGRE